MSILCIANQKGGVGKTTTAVNLAAGLARAGQRVLLIDLDIQGSATATLGATPAHGDLSLADCMTTERPVLEVIRDTSTDGLKVAPAGDRLALVDIHLATAMAREHVLKRCLASSLPHFDHVVIDTAPYLGLLTMNALVAADHILVPVSCEYLPILGLKLFGETLARIGSALGAPCDVLGYLLTLYDRREKITVEVEKILRRNFGAAVFENPIRINTRHKAAPSHRQTIYQYERKNGRGRADYDHLVDEVLARVKARGEQSFARLLDEQAAARVQAGAIETAAG
ncbi:MAG: ParA family protein [Myxococcales bacterium]|nr:ParA family protein [Myxococcales bacterium]